MRVLSALARIFQRTLTLQAALSLAFSRSPWKGEQKNKHMQFISSLPSIASSYDAFILDLWGVIHDGTQLYPGVKECLERLRAEKKQVIFLSNAPRRASIVKDALAQMGVGEALYDEVITSGEAAFLTLTAAEPYGTHYIYIGLEKDRRLLEGQGYREVEKAEQADFFLLAHSTYDNQPWEELEPVFRRALERKLPLLCINPDTEIVRITGEHVYCAGALAARYEEMGGKAVYFGKPHPAVYALCLEHFRDIPKSRILAVGDNPATDIKGAVATGLSSLLITGGILHKIVGTPKSESYITNCRNLFNPQDMPTYLAETFNWTPQ